MGFQLCGGGGGIKPALTTRSWMWESFNTHSTGPCVVNRLPQLQCTRRYCTSTRCGRVSWPECRQSWRGCRYRWIWPRTGGPAGPASGLQGTTGLNTRSSPQGGITRLNTWASLLKVLITGDHKARKKLPVRGVIFNTRVHRTKHTIQPRLRIY